MRYDQRSGKLFRDNGELLKRVSCPLGKRWDELQIIEVQEGRERRPHPMKRHCAACRRDVVDITDFDEDQVAALVAVEPDACLYASSRSKHIVFDPGIPANREPHGKKPVLFGGYTCTVNETGAEVVVQTARTESAINYWISRGLRPLFREVQRSPSIKEKLILIRRSDGTVTFSSDYRAGFGDVYWFNPYCSPLPVAAYMIPSDLEEGTRVFIPDLIEDLPGVRLDQGGNYRRLWGYAQYQNGDLTIEYVPEAEFMG